MKRVLSFLLALTLCLSLCACSAEIPPELDSDYVGQWKCMRITSSEGDSEESVITLNADGTGSYNNIHGTWRYSKENNWVVLEIDPGNVILTLSEADGTTVLKYYSDTYYRVEEFLQYGTQTITITSDNWQDYFDLIFLPEPQYNTFGQITGLDIGLYLQLQSQYAAKLLTGSVSGEYLLRAPCLHRIWCESYSTCNFTYNIYLDDSSEDAYRIDLEETKQETFQFTAQRETTKCVRISEYVWTGFADSVEITENRLTTLAALYSQMHIPDIAGTITVFKS